jgi:predicted RNA binding protein YcfA (HicA-like mRNA interferase family)
MLVKPFKASGFLIAKNTTSPTPKSANDDGWAIVATRGSHRRLKHPVKPGRVTVLGKPSDDVAPSTLNSIMKQSGLRK